MDRTHILKICAEKSGYNAEKEQSYSSVALQKLFLSSMEDFNQGTNNLKKCISHHIMIVKAINSHF